MQSINAYFIGGPEDLTKRAMKSAISEVRVAEMEPMRFVPEESRGDGIEPIHMKQHRYICYGEMPRQGDVRVFIYVHDGVVQ